MSLLPVASLTRLGLWTIIPAAVLTVAAVCALPRLRINADIVVGLPVSDAVLLEEERISRTFTSADYILIAVQRADLFSRENLAALQEMCREIAGIPGVERVLSVTTAEETRLVGEELVAEPLYREGDAAPSLEQRLAADPLLARFLLSPDGRAVTVYVFPEPSADSAVLVPALYQVAAAHEPGAARLFGERVIRWETERCISRDIRVLGSVALVVVLVVLVLFARGLAAGLLLWVGCLLPTLWTIALFPLLGIEMQVMTIMVPIVVLALSTSYGIHVLRRYSLLGQGGMPATLREVTPIVFAAGLTTIGGFSTLLFSSIEKLRVFGALLMAGITLALLTALFLLPPFLCRLPVPRPRAASPRPAPRRPRTLLSLTIWVVGLGLLAAGVWRIDFDYRSQVIFGDGTDLGRAFRYFDEHWGGTEELELRVDTRREYGLVDARSFAGLRGLAEAVRSLPEVSDVISPVEFVDWMNGHLEGSPVPLQPRNDREIGEALELLSSYDPGLRIDSLVDVGYSQARLLVRFRVPSGISPGDVLRDLEREIPEIARSRLPDAAASLGGLPITYERVIAYVARGQAWSALIFLGALYAYLTLLLRSPRWAAIALMPTATSVFVLWGLIGWLGVPLTVLMPMAAAAVMGVSVDDVLCLLLTYRQAGAISADPELLATALRTSRSAIVQTTLIIVAGLAVLLLSTTPLLGHSGLLAAASMSAATGVTVLLVPRLMALGVRRGGERAARRAP